MTLRQWPSWGRKGGGLFRENLLQQFGYTGGRILSDAGFLLRHHEKQTVKGLIGDILVEIEAQGVGKGNALDLGVQEEGLGLGRRFLGGPVHAQLEGVHLAVETGGSRGRRGLPGPPGRQGLLGEKLPGAVAG